MIQKNQNQKPKYNAFTLVEMVIVLVIMGILLMATVYLSGEQIQKVKDKTVKESILSEMQTRYSRNLGSSSFAGEMYDTLEVSLTGGENKIDFKYNAGAEEKMLNTFTDNFEIVYITLNYNDGDTSPTPIDNIKLKYSPYKISCKIGEDEGNNKLVMITKVNNNKNYCFETYQKNCRLIEMSEERCEILENLAGLK